MRVLWEALQVEVHRTVRTADQTGKQSTVDDDFTFQITAKDLLKVAITEDTYEHRIL